MRLPVIDISVSATSVTHSNFKFKNTMKPFGFALALLLCSACGNNTPKGYTLQGNFPGLEDGMIAILREAESEDQQELARDTVRNGQFELRGSVASPMFCALTIENRDVVPEGKQPKTNYGTYLFLDHAKLEMQAAHYDSLPYLSRIIHVENELEARVTGGQTQADYIAYRQALLPLEKAAYNAGDTLGNLRFFHKYKYPAEEYARIYAELYPPQMQAEAQVRKAQLAFIRQHPVSPVSLYLAEQLARKEFTLTREEVEELARLTAPADDTVRQPRLQKLLEHARLQCKNAPFPDTDLVTTAGDSVRLSAYVQPGRYTLIDMWASWCGACRAAIPLVKSLYGTYSRAQSDVVSISLDTKKADWEKAMQEEAMPWTQLWVGNGRNYNALIAKYNLLSIPRLLLIDPQGNVIFSSYDADGLKVTLDNALK